MLNTFTLMEALDAAMDPAREPESVRRYGVWDVPKTYLHLYPENNRIMDWDRPISRFGGATAFEMAQRGFARHISQQRYFSVRKTGVHDCRNFGLYRSFRGPDIHMDDFFEGLAPYPDEPYPYAAIVIPAMDLPRYAPAGLSHYLRLRALSLEVMQCLRNPILRPILYPVHYALIR